MENKGIVHYTATAILQAEESTDTVDPGTVDAQEDKNENETDVLSSDKDSTEKEETIQNIERVDTPRPDCDSEEWVFVQDI